jgi:hypothetical protein
MKTSQKKRQEENNKTDPQRKVKSISPWTSRLAFGWVGTKLPLPSANATQRRLNSSLLVSNVMVLL